MNDIVRKLYELGIVPVVTISDSEDAVPLARALHKGGIGCMEITFRTKTAITAMRKIAAEVPEMLIGAGTVHSIDQIQQAMNAGAKFIVTPGFHAEVVEHCISHDIPIIPGCSDTGGIEQALHLGIKQVKFFPAEASGGVHLLQMLQPPYSDIEFLPTGGINLENMNDYLELQNVFAIGGTWMVKEELLVNKEFDKIEKLAKEAVSRMFGFQLKHIGINCLDQEQAGKASNDLKELFGIERRDGETSIFAGTMFELMKKPYLGVHGHIAIGVNNLDRVYSYLKGLGYSFNESTKQIDDRQRLKVIYLQKEIAGFAIHFINN